MQLLQHFHKLSIHPKNATELKGLILQLAIQGKLTADWRNQNPELITGINTAENLLKSIKAEKKALIKKKIIRKIKTSPLNKNDFYLDIPKNWEWIKIGNLGALFNGNSVNKNVKAAKYEGLSDGYPYLGTKDVGYGFEKINYENGIKIPKNEEKFKVAHKGAVLICSEGGSAGKKCGIVSEDVCFGNKLYAVEPFLDIESVFILSLYLTPVFFEQFQKRMTGIIGGISTSKFCDIAVPLPPIEEQKEIVRIVEIFFKEVEQLENLTKQRIHLKQDYVASALNKLATQNTQTAWQELTPHFSRFFDDVTNIKKLRETILQLAVQGKLTTDWRARHPELVEGQHHASELLKSIHKEKARLIKEKKIKKEKALPPITQEEIPYELPEGWVWCRLNEILHSSFYGPRFGKEDYVDNGVPTIRTTDMNSKGYIVLKNPPSIRLSEEKLKLYKVLKGDLLVTRTGSIGTMAIFNEGYDAIPSAYLIRFRFLIMEIKYVFNLLHSPYGQKALGLLTNTLAQPNINAISIRNIPFPLPPLNEQKAIVQKVNALMGLCDGLEQKVKISEQQVQDLMQSMLREVFEGKSAEEEALPMAAEPAEVYGDNKSGFDDIFESLNYDHEVAAVVLLTKERFGFTYGKKYIHKMFSNIDLLNELPVFNQLQFQEYGWGMYSPILKKTLENEVFITYQSLGNNKRTLQVKPKAIPQIKKWIKANENNQFVNQVKQILEVYEQPLIDLKMDRIELLNTVLECIVVLKTDILKDIRAKMKNWKMFEGNYNTKAEKFTENETLHMIHFIKGLKINY